MNYNMVELCQDDIESINGGLAAGILFGSIMGFTAGAVAGAAATVYYGDYSGKTMSKWLYTGTSFGAACGVFAPF